MIDTDKHEKTIKDYEFRKRELMIYTDRNEQHPLGEYKFRQKDWQVRRFINDAIHAGWTLSSMKEIYDEAMEEVKRLRGLLNTIADKALHEVNTQPNGDDSPYNNILNIAYEGVIE